MPGEGPHHPPLRIRVVSQKVLIEPVSAFSDARGSVFEPVGPACLREQGNVHVVVSEPGTVRGNHYHPLGTEVLVVIGPALVRTRQDGEVTDTHIPEGQIYRFTIPPGVAHAIKNTGTTTNVGIAFNTEIHDPQNPDMVREVILDA